jgi:hypothetical protein
VIGSSKPLGPGFQTGVVVGTGCFTDAPFLDGELEVIPAQVEGSVSDVLDRVRLTSFSWRNICLKSIICRPVAESSRTVGGPWIMAIRLRSSAVTTSSRNGA